MNNLSSRQRKIGYVVGILLLLVPVVLLGMPAGGEGDSGGYLARMRHEYDLGESDLGRIDPTSSTMNLVLLGFRGIAVNLLRADLDYYKDHKEWARLRSTTEAVITLQPHYIEVWRYLSWNLAFNVSAEWDAVPDRYFWVKEGGKFSQRGASRNKAVPELYYETGRVWGQKVGRSDEWKFFRGYFLKDPDEKIFAGSADPEINPDGIDNYLVAKRWYQDANTAEENRVQHIMMRALFRSYPSRSQIDYAEALQREGKFTGSTVAAWSQAYQDWTQDYGKMEFQGQRCRIYLEANEDNVKEMAREQNVPLEEVERELNFVQNTTNYRYWRTRTLAEKNEQTAEAHQLLYNGEEKIKEGELASAEDLLYRGMAAYSRLLQEYPELAVDDLCIEEGMWGVLLWSKTLDLQQKPKPQTYPLKELWERNQGALPQLEDRFNREIH